MSITGPNGVTLPAITDVGDLPYPLNWIDTSGNTPPEQFNNVDPNTEYPNNGDGRMWWGVSASNPGLGTITFQGSTAYLTGTLGLTWQITDGADDGSVPVLIYSVNGGSSWTTVALSDTLQMGLINIDLTTAEATGFQFYVAPQGGVANSDGTLWYVAVSINRNDQPPVATWQAIGSEPGPEDGGLDPLLYNPQVIDPMPYDDLATLQTRILVALGFSAQQANPPPGLLGFITEKIQASQNFLYRKYPALNLRHWFRYKLVPGQRFYSTQDNDENINVGFVLDPYKPIEAAFCQDNRNVWYPLLWGIPPDLYTMLSKPWRPARIEIRETSIEVYPAPDITYYVWLKAHTGLSSFSNSTDLPSIDSELVYMYALGACKAHYGQADAAQVLAQAKDYLGELVGGTHATRRYIPASLPLPPAIRPTLTHFDGLP